MRGPDSIPAPLTCLGRMLLLNYNAGVTGTNPAFCVFTRGVS